MQQIKYCFIKNLTLVAATISILFFNLAISAEVDDVNKMIAEGKKITFDRTKGNCLACHQIAEGESPGNIGPVLINMKTRYPDKTKLREKIWDATAINSETSMPPFGNHQILSESEINLVVEFIWSK